MRPASLMLCLALAAAARAQQPPQGMAVGAQGGPAGVNIQLSFPGGMPQQPQQVAPAPQAAATVTSSYSSSADGYSLAYRSNPKGRTVFTVVAPQGGHVLVTAGSQVVLDDDIPTSFDAEGDRFYRFKVTQNGVVWSRKLQAKDGMTATLSVMPLAASAQVAVSAGPTPQVAQPPAAHTAISDGDFAQLLQSYQGQAFEEGRTDVLTSASSNWFTCAQLGRLMDAAPFSAEKVRVVQVLKDHIVDANHEFLLYNHLSFDDDKMQLRHILGH